MAWREVRPVPTKYGRSTWASLAWIFWRREISFKLTTGDKGIMDEALIAGFADTVLPCA